MADNLQITGPVELNNDLYKDPGMPDCVRRLRLRLKPKQCRFIMEWMKSHNPYDAAERVGYKRTAVSYLMNNPKVKAAIRAIQDQNRDEGKIESRELVGELSRVAFFNPKNLYNSDGSFKGMHNLSDADAMCIRKIRTIRARMPGEDGKPIPAEILDIEVWDKMDALKQLAQHLGLLKDTVQINNTVQVINWQSMLEAERPSVDLIERRMAELVNISQKEK